MPMLTFGSGMQKIASTHKVSSGHLMTEDSAFSIYFLILRSKTERSSSWTELEAWMNQRTGTDFMRLANSPVMNGIYVEALQDRVRRMAARRFNAFMAEFLSQAILKRLGIETVPAEICKSDEIPTDRGYLVKSVVPTGDLKFTPFRCCSGFVLISRIVPNAASVDYIQRKFFSFYRSPFTWRGLGEREIGELDERLSREATEALSKSCPAADELFREFEPTELYRIKHSIDGEPYLRILAARVFLGVSAGHFANVLCTAEGDLLSIDHARMQRENGDDLRMLFRFVRRGSQVFDLLGDIAKLKEQDVIDAVDSVPKHQACGPMDGIADYFVERLRLWKELFSGKTSPDHELTYAGA